MFSFVMTGILGTQYPKTKQKISGLGIFLGMGFRPSNVAQFITKQIKHTLLL